MSADTEGRDGAFWGRNPENKIIKEGEEMSLEGRRTLPLSLSLCINATGFFSMLHKLPPCEFIVGPMIASRP